MPSSHLDDPVPYLDHPVPLAFAHRGGTDHFPENSWKAFENAVRLGYRYLETDLHATKDGALIAFHDDNLDRVTNRTGQISKLTAAEVAEARIEGSEPIPLLADLLTAWPDVRFNLDVKVDAAVRPLVDVLGRTNCWDRVCIASFSSRRLADTRKLLQLLDHPVCMAASPQDIAALLTKDPSTLAAGFATRWVKCAQVPARMATRRRLIDRAHAAGLQVHAWTVNDRAVMERLLDRGVDGIITDETELLRDVLMARSQWRPTAAASAGLPAQPAQGRTGENAPRRETAPGAAGPSAAGSKPGGRTRRRGDRTLPKGGRDSDGLGLGT